MTPESTERGCAVGVVDDFVSQYERQFDFWEALARTVQDLLEAELRSSGLRAIVSSRAKTVDRLNEKLKHRDSERPYKSVAEVGEDIADLAGVRVALYFPGQMDEVERVINRMLDVQVTKRFPLLRPSPSVTGGADEPSLPLDPEVATAEVSRYRQRFSGYGARHYRVFLPAARLSSGQERYASALVEVQVASVLMHAWSEVEHDLVYKPLEGELSSSEYALLDQLNGLVIAGEIALEQLEKASDSRVAAATTPFRDHYEFADYLRTRLSASGIDLTDATLGQVDVLFSYLVEQGVATAHSVENYLDQLEQDFEQRPVADQLADLMLTGNESRYSAYLRAASEARSPSRGRRATMRQLRAESPEKFAIGEFVAAWVLFEALVRDLAESPEGRPLSAPALFRRLAERKLLLPLEYEELDQMRHLRNQVMHGRAEGVSADRLVSAAAWLRDLTAAIDSRLKD